MIKLLSRFILDGLIPLAIFFLYLYFGYQLFLFLIGYAFGGEISKLVLVLLLAGFSGAILLSFLPSLIWRNWSYVLPFAYAGVTLTFAFGALGDIGSSKGWWPFFIWFGLAVVLILGGYLGSFAGRRVSYKRNQMKPNKTLQLTPSRDALLFYDRLSFPSTSLQSLGA